MFIYICRNKRGISSYKIKYVIEVYDLSRAIALCVTLICLCAWLRLIYLLFRLKINFDLNIQMTIRYMRYSCGRPRTENNLYWRMKYFSEYSTDGLSILRFDSIEFRILYIFSSFFLGDSHIKQQTFIMRNNASGDFNYSKN